ncbi:MAG: ankyrin repeat domain-containing protein [Armatimonadota bacterium]
MDAELKAHALLEAVSAGNTTEVTALLAHGADPKSSPAGTHHSPLYVAAERGDVEVLKLLLGAGAQPSHDELAVAAGAGHWNAVKFLLAQGIGADPALDYLGAALARAIGGLNPLVRLLLERGANPNHREPWGLAALHILVRWGPANVQLVELLLQHGADPNARNDEGETPLMWAARRGPNDLVKALLDGGADPNLLNEQGSIEMVIASTALTEAVMHGQTVCAIVLMTAGADPNLPNTGGETPLMLAVDYAPQLVPDLLRWGADPSIRDRSGLTAAARAARQHLRLQEILAEAAPTSEV